MLPSARRAELSRQYFDNSYLSRRAFELDPTGVSGVPYPGVGIEPSQHLHHQHDPLPKPHQQHPHQHRSRAPFGRDGGSVRSRTTAGLTTFDEDLDIDDYGGGGRRRPSDHHHRNGEDSPDSHHFRSAAEADEAESDFSDQDSLGSVRSGDSYPSSKSYGAGIRYANSAAGQIWNILDRMDDVVLEVKANVCQCQRLGARLAALKKPMVAVHKGRQTADHAVLATIKDLVMEAQHFMERFLDPDWWRKGAGRKEDSEMFRELTFRLGFLMQAPPGFQEQSQEEDHADRLKDYADLQAVLEERLHTTKDERRANEIMEVLRRIRMRAAAEGAGTSPEIDVRMLHFDKRARSLGNGGFGTVSVATIGSTQVAVKRLNHQNVRMQLLEEMRRDVQGYHQLQYDFVAKTIGACTVRPNLCIVTERAPMSLFSLLHASEDNMLLPPEEKAAMLYDVARGVQFLHIKRIIHGNLKSTNILVFENNRLKVCDFGLIAVRESQSIMGGGDTVPSAAWTAPEVLDDQDPSVLSDVYSFGVLIHEVLTQRIPFAGKSVAKVITAVVAKGHRPGYLENEEETYPPGLTKLADVCWTQDPAARPKSLNAIVTELGHIVNALGGDPRPQAYEQAAGESTSRPPPGISPGGSSGRGGGAMGRMTAEERRIHELEQELRSLKMQQQGVSGNDSASRGNSQTWRGSSVPAGVMFGSDYGSDGMPHGLPEERTALRALYTATQGPGWHERAGWETNDPDVSTWYGVMCGDGGHVTALQLPSNNLRGQLPRELTCLSRLKTLNLADNFLDGQIPREFGKLGRLVELDLSMNDLTSAIPIELANAACLERVHLQCNALSGNIPRAMIKKLNNLKVFQVDWSDLCDTHPFRNFRKACPPATQAEVDRASSDSRLAARDRATAPAEPAVNPASYQLPGAQLQQQGGSGYSLSPGSNPPYPGGGGSGGGGSPVRGRFGSGPLRRKGSGGGGSAGSRTPMGSQEEGRGGGGGSAGGRPPAAGAGRSSSGMWGNAGYAAPTAPYKGDDGMLGKAKAKALANSIPPSKSWKTAMRKVGKTFKELVAVDLHPGFTDNGGTTSTSTPAARGDAST